MCRSRTNRAARLIVAALAAGGLGACLASCSDDSIYLDHRDSVGLSSGDAVAANEVTQMVDPWPANSGNKNIAYNGQKMQTAVERYRTNRVIPPINATTSVINVAPGDAAAPPPVQSASSGPPGSGAPQ